MHGPNNIYYDHLVNIPASVVSKLGLLILANATATMLLSGNKRLIQIFYLWCLLQNYSPENNNTKLNNFYPPCTPPDLEIYKIPGQPGFEQHPIWYSKDIQWQWHQIIFACYKFDIWPRQALGLIYRTKVHNHN